jgi:hypothetical protein
MLGFRFQANEISNPCFWIQSDEISPDDWSARSRI